MPTLPMVGSTYSTCAAARRALNVQSIAAIAPTKQNFLFADICGVLNLGTGPVRCCAKAQFGLAQIIPSRSGRAPVPSPPGRSRRSRLLLHNALHLQVN